MKNFSLTVLTTILAAALATPAQALTTCQEACNSQYLNAVNALWQAPRPAGTAPAAYRQQVLTAVNTLNQCMAACAMTPTAPAPEPEPVPAPAPGRGKK